MLLNDFAFFHEQGQLDNIRNYCQQHPLDAKTILTLVEFIATSAKNPLPSLYILLDNMTAEFLSSDLNDRKTIADAILAQTNNLRLRDFQIDLINKQHDLPQATYGKSYQSNELPAINQQQTPPTLTALPKIGQQIQNIHIPTA